MSDTTNSGEQALTVVLSPQGGKVPPPQEETTPETIAETVIEQATEIAGMVERARKEGENKADNQSAVLSSIEERLLLLVNITQTLVERITALESEVAVLIAAETEETDVLEEAAETLEKVAEIPAEVKEEIPESTPPESRESPKKSRKWL